MTTVAQRLGLNLPPAFIVEQGACSRTDPEAFYPEGQGSSAQAAKRVCMGCDVRAACLQWALDTDEQHGVWGGQSERQRRKVRRQRDAGTPREWPCTHAGCDQAYDTRRALAAHTHQRHPRTPTEATA